MANGDTGKGAYRFDSSYEEAAVLSDGTPVTLRCIRPDDKEALAAGLARLSAESRYRRFLHAKSSLSPAELKYLTEVDNVNHFAVVALGLDNQGLGLARFIRLGNAPDVAEAAVAVVDDIQGKGLGTLLLKRLGEAALERGVTHFRATILEANRPIWRLIDEAAIFETELEKGSGYVVVDIPLTPRPREAADKPLLSRLLREAANGTVTIKRFFRADS